ncbi:MAG: DEAD/DEAH box helicase, partial [Myxococcota bacterium]|nr:DEAD/DEAH box helicase [Myxococcota bacterium]
LLERKDITLEHLRFFILDEADEMLSMGFERELRAILKFLPDTRQSLLFSATVTEGVKSLAQNMLFHPEYLSFSSDSVINKDVKHTYIRVPGIARMRDLIKILEFEEPENAIIFANTRSDTFVVANFLKRHGYAAAELNGDLPQKEREKTLQLLRDSKINYLVATDVAARGIDISDLSHVINFVLPESPDVYVHRTGRTGRAGKKGKALSLISPAEMHSFVQILRQTEVELTESAMPSTRDIAEAKRGRATENFAKRLEHFEDLPYANKLGMAKRLLDDDQLSPEDLVRTIAKLLAIADFALTRDGLVEVQEEVTETATSEETPEATTEVVEEVEEEIEEVEVAEAAPEIEEEEEE